MKTLERGVVMLDKQRLLDFGNHQDFSLGILGDIPPGFEVLVAPVKAFHNHTRNEKMLAWMQADLAKRPVDRLIGFNKMPGLDVYYAADGCFEDKAQNLRHSFYRFFKRYKHFAEYERAVLCWVDS